MNKRLRRLQRRANELDQRCRAILEAAGEDGLTEEQRTEYDQVQAQRDSVLETIRRERDLESTSRELDAPVDHPEPPALDVTDDPDSSDPPEERERRVDGVHDRSSERRFASLGEQLRAVIQAESPGGFVDPRLRQERAATGMNEGTPSEGGFLVQTDFASEILRRVYETGQVLSRVRRRTITTNANGMAINAIDETSRATGSRLGGVRAYWLAEAEQKIASMLKLRRLNLRLQKIAALFYATDELLQDVGFLEAELEDAAANEIRFEVENAVLYGNGVGKPLGIFNSGAFIQVAAEGGQAADTVLLANIVKMWARLWSRSRLNVVWLINQSILPQLATLSLNGHPVYMPPGGLAGNAFSTLLGRPVIEIEYAAGVGDLGDIALVDLNEYLLIDKGGIQSASSIHVRFIYDETAFRFVYRVDGQPIWNSPLTPFKGPDTLSPYVGLAAR